MSKKLYLECYSGISGDMTVAALLDLGASQQILEEALKSLPLAGFQIKISRVQKSGLDACDFSVLLDKSHENHDHDMEYLHGGGEAHIHMPMQEDEGYEVHMHENGEEHAHYHQHENSEMHIHEHSHENTETHAHTHSHHEHRGMAEITAIVAAADITARAKTIAGRIFEILAEAEAKAHGVSPLEVHFHEVGAVDSIVDIVAVAVCLDNLGISEVIVPQLCEGGGYVRCQHGLIPVPVPAVLNIASEHGLHLHMTQIEGELVTPTGAAIAAAVKTSDQLPEHFKILKTGMGAGKRSYERPSLLRAMLIEDTKAGAADENVTDSPKERDCIWKLESNIDDVTGEALGFVMEELLRAGARDVNYMPVFMKKNRPAYQLNVICDESKIAELERIIFAHTTTIGVRRQQMERTILTRQIEEFESSFGKVRLKVCAYRGERKVYPEYEDVAAICRAQNLGFQNVCHTVVQEFLADEVSRMK